MNEFQKGIISLVRSSLTKEKAEVSAGFQWDSALDLAIKHQIIPMIFYGIQNLTEKPETEIIKKFELLTYRVILNSNNQMYALKKIFTKFNERNVDFMPLKGTVLKHIYPYPELRPMSDADILVKVDQFNIIRSIMSELEFEEVLESDHEYTWRKKDILYLELHKRLIPSYNKDYYKYYGDGWQFAVHREGNRYDMRIEDNYIYLFTHYAKHYRDGGIGIRHITDLYVFSNAYPQLDYSYVEEELERLDLLEFYNNTKHTINVWFNSETSDYMSDFVTDRIFESGSYGTYNTHLLSQAVKKIGSENNKNKIDKRIIMDRLLPPYKDMVLRYKCLEKYRFLLPFMWMLRFLQIPFDSKNIEKNIKNLKTVSSENVTAYRKGLETVGLKYNFKE